MTWYKAQTGAATLSIAGLYNYDSTVFDNLALPDGVVSSSVVNNILLECSELNLLYPDAAFMKTAIGAWSTMMLPTWTKIYALSQLDYNPIENYDRIENEVENIGNSRTSNSTGTENRKDTGTSNRSTGSENSSTTGGTDTNNVTGYNANTMVANNQMVSSSTTTGSDNSNEVNNYNSGSVNLTQGQENETEQTARNRSSRIHGNIGVSTPADMMLKELEIYPLINVVAKIVDDFKRRFCVLVY